MSKTALLMADDEVTDIPEIIFESGLPGFPGEQKFALVAWDDGPYSSLTSLSNPDIEFVVLPPYVFFPDYEPELDDTTAQRLGIESSDDAIILVIVSVNTDDVSKSTANLLGPIVINLKTRQAAQAVLQGSDYEVKTPLVSA